MVGYICDLSLLLTVFNVWSVVKSFAIRIHLDLNLTETNYTETFTPKLSWSEIYESYKAIRRLCELINKPFGTMIFLYMMDTILFQSIALDTIVGSPDATYRFRLLMFVAASTVNFVVSADIMRQVSIIKACTIVCF